MRIEKVAILNEVTARIKESDYCFIVNYGGVDVVKMGALRADLRACDSRLLVVKNSYLAKVAAVAGVKVLNLNDLTQALRPPLLPGEAMRALIVKEGKEPGQGVAYMPDGTMLVVEGGRRLLGESAAVVVTSVLQTSAGRMVFARVK